MKVEEILQEYPGLYILTDAVRNAAVPEEVETFDDLRRRSGLVVEHVTFSAAQVGVERVAVDEVDRSTTLVVIERRTAVTHRCFTPSRTVRTELHKIFNWIMEADGGLFSESQSQSQRRRLTCAQKLTYS